MIGPALPFRNGAATVRERLHRAFLSSQVYHLRVPGFSQRFGLVLAIAAVALCVALHVTTFVVVVPFFWLLIPMGLVAGVVLCSEAAGTQQRFAAISARRLGVLNAILLVYVICTYVYVYRATGGASSVSVLDGQYVALYHGRVINTITEHEYRMFSTLWTRAGSVWIGMMASFGLAHLAG